MNKKNFLLTSVLVLFICSVFSTSSHAAPNSVEVVKIKESTYQFVNDIQSIQAYSDKGIIIAFKEELPVTVGNTIRIKDTKGTIFTSVNSKKINSTNYTYEFKMPLVIGDEYYVLGETDYRFKFDYRHQSQLYVITEKTRSLNSYQFKLAFNNNLDPLLALKSDHYRVAEGLWIKSVKFDIKDNGELDLQTLILETEAQMNGNKYTLYIDSRVKDSEQTQLNTSHSSITLYGAAEDNSEPKVERVMLSASNQIRIEFNETSGLEYFSTQDKTNYRLFDLETNRYYEIKAVQLTKNKMTDVYANVVLTTENLSPGKRYMVEVLRVKDILGNTISDKNYYRGSFTYDSSLVNSLRLVGVECFSSDTLKVNFNRSVSITTDFKLDDIRFSSGSKALEVHKDPVSSNAIVVKTDGNGKSGFHTIRIANIGDCFGNVTTQGTAVGSYVVNISDEQRPFVSFLEVDTYNRYPGITVTYTKPMDKNSVEDIRNYSVQGLNILYVYQVSNNKVRVITSSQVQGTVYNLEVKAVKDVYGQSLQSNYYSGPFIGKNLND